MEMIRYKGEDCGIRVTVREESYTSKASALDFDEMPTFDKKESGAKPVFSGRRIKRGLYRSAKGQLINADINAAANIGRKELGDEWLRKLLELDGGVLVDTPAVVRNLHASENIRQWLEIGNTFPRNRSRKWAVVHLNRSFAFFGAPGKHDGAN